MNKANRKPRTRTKPATSVAPFLHKIYEILENPVHNDLISWNEEGTAFLIKNVTEFTEKVLPKYFKHNNFASFVRQLNLYDFHKSRYENNGSEFYHKLFKRHEKHLLSEIKRKMPNEAGSDSPPQYQGMQEEMGMDGVVQVNGQGDASLQNLINRQDQLENAMKMVFSENKRLSKENKLLWTEVTSLKNKQMTTEKATKTINTQNSQLLKENRCLWSELIMNKEKFERQIEKLLVLLFSIAQHSGKTPSNLFKKKNLSSTRNTAGNEEEDGAWANNDANNNYSVMPAKTFNKKGTKTQLDKILEHFEEEGLGTLFGNKPLVLEEKDWIKFSSFLDVETGTNNNNNRPSLEFFNDKRPSQIDTSFEKEDPREIFSKMCKIEYDQNVPTIVEEKNFIEVPNSPNFERLLKPEKLFDITNSPVPLEKAMNELELSPVAAKGRPGIFEYDVVHGAETCFLQLQKNPSFFQGNFLEEEFENENQQDDKKDISYFMNRSLGLGKSRGSSQIDFSGKGEPKFDEVMHFFNNHQLNNSNHDNNNDSFHNSFFNLGGMNTLHNDPNSLG